MTKTESEIKQDSISSNVMEVSPRSEKILELGRKLVEELDLGTSVDTLGRWMAHYLAELIVAVETTPSDRRAHAEQECFEAILRLWKHRADLPPGKRPYEALEPIARAIESLDPDDDTPRYFRSARPPRGKDEEKSELDSWLDMISGIDYSAKLLIGYCLSQAALAAKDKSEEWVKLAEEAGLEHGVPELIIRFISTADEVDKKPDADAELRKKLKSRIKRLKGLVDMSGHLVNDLNSQLAKLPPPTDEGKKDDRVMVISEPPDFG